MSGAAMSGGIIDRAALRQLLDVIGGDRDDLDELLEDYRSTAPDLAAEISVAAEAGDLDRLRIAAHTLKSNARDFGALRLSSLCEALERECRAGLVADARGSAAAIFAAEADARRALDDVDLDER